MAWVWREFALHVMAYNLGRGIARGALSALLHALPSATGSLARLLQRRHLACAASAPQSA